MVGAILGPRTASATRREPERTGSVVAAPRRRRRGNWFVRFTNSRGFALTLFGIGFVLCVVGAISQHQDAVTLRDHGVRAQAVVTAVHGGKDNYVTLEFTTASGEPVTADVGNYRWSPSPHVGDTPTVLYDPQDPSGLVADVRQGPDFFSVWLICAGAVFAAVMWWLTLTGRIDWAERARRRRG